MPLKIYFDDITHEPLIPTLVLANRNGDKLGVIPSTNLVISDALKTHSELSFKVYKRFDNVDYPDWDKVKDFQLLWCKEWNEYFELNVELNESNELVKDVIATSLGEAELSQTNLYNVEINTEDDIAREDYKDPTVFYNTSDPASSLLNRILEKVPHYEIKHVDSSLKDIQRTFSFDGKSIYDALQEIEEEINCLFIFSTADNNGNLKREISAYDLESYCYKCQHRGEFLDKCPKCSSTDVKNGFGEDTTIFISTDNLTDEITYSTDVGAVKNCFKLEAGDDLMTATIANCNPNGSSYIWYIPENIRKDMSQSLQNKLSLYDEKYEYYQKDHKTNISSSMRNKYNTLLAKYRAMFPNSNSVNIPSDIPSEIVGYPNLMLAYYDTIDFELFLRNKLMPTVSLTPTTAQKEVNKISTNIITNGTGNIGVLNLNSVSLNTITGIITSLVRAFIDSDYRVQINEGATYDEEKTHRWTGSFNIYKYSDPSDSADTGTMTVTVVDTYSTYVSQQLTKSLAEASDENPYGVVALFKSSDNDFKAELKKYGLNSLTSYRTICQACLDLLIEQGVSNEDYWEKESNGNDANNLYKSFYLNYFNKLKYIDNEIKIRESELNTVVGIKDDKNRMVTDGMQSLLEKAIISIQDILNFQKFLGDDWTEFISYRREDTYSNSNYISDGLNNAELLNKANEFLGVAKKEIVKSATLQHSISATLKNLLVMQEFTPLTSYFKVGNWLRICVDEDVYRLRLMSYEIDFDSLETLNVTFSDVMSTADGYSDIESILSQAESMSTAYDGIMRQAKQGSKGNQMLQNWVSKGLDLTNMKIIGKASNQNISWDENGFLCREYSDITDEYDDRQLKIINRGLYVTDDGWLTAKAGIGNFTFYNPKTEKWQESYGVIADTLVGNLILSEEVGIYNPEGSITLDKNGLVITVEPDVTEDDQTTFEIRRKKNDPDDPYDKVLYFDSNGNACFKGKVSATELFIGDDSGDSTINDYIYNILNDTELGYSLSTEIFNMIKDETDAKVSVLYSESIPINANKSDFWVNTVSQTVTQRQNEVAWIQEKSISVKNVLNIIKDFVSDPNHTKEVVKLDFKSYAPGKTGKTSYDFWCCNDEENNIRLRYLKKDNDSDSDSDTGTWVYDDNLPQPSYDEIMYFSNVSTRKIYFLSENPENVLDENGARKYKIVQNDIWYNTSNSSIKVYGYTWTSIYNDELISFLNKINTVLSTKDNKVNIYTSNTPPNPQNLFNPQNITQNSKYNFTKGYTEVANGTTRTAELIHLDNSKEYNILYYQYKTPNVRQFYTFKYSEDESYIGYQTATEYSLAAGKVKMIHISGTSAIGLSFPNFATRYPNESPCVMIWESTDEKGYESEYIPYIEDLSYGDIFVSPETRYISRWDGKKWIGITDENDLLLMSQADLLSDNYSQLEQDVSLRPTIYAQYNDPNTEDGITVKYGDIWIDLNTDIPSYWNGTEWSPTTIDLDDINNSLEDIGTKLDDFQGNLDDVAIEIDNYNKQFENYKAEIGQYLQFKSDEGLTIGARNSKFKTVMDNKALRFTEDGDTVAYVSNAQLLINNAVIRNALQLKGFLFKPHDNDEGFSIVYKSNNAQ